MMRSYLTGLALFLFLADPAFSGDKTDPVSDRGAMLYENHCDECHTEQVHWRKKRLVADKKSLFAEVKRWQHALNLDWTKTDIDEVSQYLNDRFYHY